MCQQNLTKAQDRSAQTPFADEEKEWADRNKLKLLGLQTWQLDQWDLTYGPTELFWVVDWRGPLIPAVGSYNFDFLTLLGLLRFVGGGKQDDISVVVGVVVKIWAARTEEFWNVFLGVKSDDSQSPRRIELDFSILKGAEHHKLLHNVTEMPMNATEPLLGGERFPLNSHRDALKLWRWQHKVCFAMFC